MSCSDYYVCSFINSEHERVDNFTCPSGLYFDRITKTCNWPENVDCTLSNDNKKSKNKTDYLKLCPNGDGFCKYNLN